MIFRLIPLLLMLGGIYKGLDRFTPILNFTQVSAVQSELSQLVRIIQLDSLESQLEFHSQQEFSEYVRRNMTSKKRPDTSIDPWGQPYLFDGSGGGLKIISTGPDKVKSTRDDIVLVVR